jgi:hypothetical protein
VVDVPAGRVRGGFCIDCEEREFGRSAAGNWSHVDGCGLCRRDGFYAIPRWRPYTVREGGRIVCKVDYRIDGATLRLCDEHFSAITHGDPWPRPTGTRSREETGDRG